MGVRHRNEGQYHGDAGEEHDDLAVTQPGLAPLFPWSSAELGAVRFLLEGGGTIDETADLLGRPLHDVAQVAAHEGWTALERATEHEQGDEASEGPEEPANALLSADFPVLTDEIAEIALRSRIAAEIQAASTVAESAESLTEKEAMQRSEDRWEQKNRHRRWSQRSRQAKDAVVSTLQQVEEMEVEAMAEVDRATKIDKVAHRKAVQVATLPEVKAKSDVVWEKTIAHETSKRRWTAGWTSLIPEICERSVRSVQIDLCPEVIPRAPVTASRRQTVEMIEEHRCESHAKRNNTAHFILSWPHGVVPSVSEAAVSARRMCMRVGLDLHQQGSAAFLHYDRDHYHVHLLVGRSRLDGGLWSPGLGIDRVMALESRLLANEHGQEWNQRMVGRSEKSRIGGAKAAEGALCAKIRYAHLEPMTIAWQGAEVDARYEMDYLAQGPHAGVCIAKMVGLRPAHSVVTYCQR